jgi:hypothetical protein
MTAFVMNHKRLPFCSSPDKGRIGGVYSDKIGFSHNFPPQPSLNPPCQGGSGQKRFHPHHTVASRNCPAPAKEASKKQSSAVAKFPWNLLMIIFGSV